MVNTAIVESQMESAINLRALGPLMGEITIKDGRVEQSSFHDYQVIRMDEAPKVDVHIVESSEHPGGIGEPGRRRLRRRWRRGVCVDEETDTGASNQDDVNAAQELTSECLCRAPTGQLTRRRRSRTRESLCRGCAANGRALVVVSLR